MSKFSAIRIWTLFYPSRPANRGHSSTEFGALLMLRVVDLVILILNSFSLAGEGK